MRLCVKCLEKVREKNKGYRNRVCQSSDKASASPQYLFPWPGAVARKTIAPFMAGREVIDLFGGASKIAMAVSEYGGTVVAWNDLHPLLWRFTHDLVSDPDPLLADIQALRGQMCKTWPRDRLLSRYQEAMENPLEDPLGSALFYWASRMFSSGSAKRINSPAEGPPGSLRQPPPEAVQGVTRALQGATLTRLDFSEVLGNGVDKEGRVIIADPPWPGSGNFEFHMEGRHTDLVRSLVNARSDFVLLMSSSQATQRALAEGLPKKGGRKVHLYYRQGVLGKEVIATTIPMDDGVGISLMKRPR